MLLGKLLCTEFSLNVRMQKHSNGVATLLWTLRTLGTVRFLNSVSSGRFVCLADGNKLPHIGLGCYKLNGQKEVWHSVSSAISCGYRLFDTAAYYGNEVLVGAALRASGLQREDFYVVTKLWHADHGFAESIAAIGKSLSNLNLDYIDLYLVHGPSAGKNLASWEGILEMKQKGFIKSTGVSNFNIHHLQPFRDFGLEMPVVNQIELHPWLQQRHIVEYCHKNNITMMGFCPLARGNWASPDNQYVLRSICQRHAKSPPQVLLRWAVQKGFIAIPKSTKLNHIVENIGVFDFELDTADLNSIDGLDCGLRVSNDSILSPWHG